MVTTLYSAAITDALSKRESSLDSLVRLRDQTHEQIKSQGDLSLQLVRLLEEIDRRT